MRQARTEKRMFRACVVDLEQYMLGLRFQRPHLTLTMTQHPLRVSSRRNPRLPRGDTVAVGLRSEQFKSPLQQLNVTLIAAQ